MGISKQAVCQYESRQAHLQECVAHLILEAEALRKRHPGCGVEKMYEMIRPSFLGRDRFIEIMMEAGFRLKRSKNQRRTTWPGKITFLNLIKGLQVKEPGEVWQSDITYIAIGERFYYAVFILDVYTKKIVGYSLSTHLRAGANEGALKRALKTHAPPRIHHSDRGSQYSSKGYVSLLRRSGISISMSGKGQDNAYAERINKTIKEEYLYYWKAKSFEQLRVQLTRAVKHYNEERPHNSILKMSPAAFEKYYKSLPLNQKPVITIFDNNNP